MLVDRIGKRKINKTFTYLYILPNRIAYNA